MEALFHDWLSDSLANQNPPLRQADLRRALLLQGHRVSSATISRWLNGYDLPTAARCEALARVFGVPPGDVMLRAGHSTRSQSPVPLSTQLRSAMHDAIELERKLDHARLTAGGVPVVVLPVIGQVAAAHDRLALNDDVAVLPSSWAAGNDPANLIAVLVGGDCLSPFIQRGDVAIIDRQASPKPGDIVLVAFDGGHQLKALARMRGSSVDLVCNEGVLRFATSTVSVEGVATAFTHRLDRTEVRRWSSTWTGSGAVPALPTGQFTHDGAGGS